VRNVLLDEALEEEFEDYDTQISIRFQSARDAHEESWEKNIATIGTHGGEGPFISGRRDGDLMSGLIIEGTLVCDRVVFGYKIDMGSINGGFGGEDGGGGGYGSIGGGSGSNSNNTIFFCMKMLHANPGNPLLLTNYARFL